ncbi:MAG: zinc metalloprotease HtpX [Candidatus Korobacteraceae bacterium]
MGNLFKTTLLLGLLTGFLLFVGQYFGGQNGLMIALVMAGVMNFVSYFFSDKIALAMYRAKPITRDQAPRLYDMTERLTQRAGLPMPKLFVIPESSPNAFATGRNPKHSAVAVTQGLMDLLSDEEVEGVIAHELGHVRNRDILIASVAATIAGAITFFARMAMWGAMFGGYGGRDDRDRGGGVIGQLALIILAPMAAMMIQFAISRSREFAADATASKITGNPYGLANALRKLDGYSRQRPLVASANTAHMFIVKPAINMGEIANLFSTHPPIPQRIERLIGKTTQFE